MQWRPTRIVRATTEAEVDAALASADKVVVEGDDRLLSYAASKASGDPDNRIAVEIGDDHPPIFGQDDFFEPKPRHDADADTGFKAEMRGAELAEKRRAEITVTIPNAPARTNLLRILLIVVPLLACLVVAGILAIVITQHRNEELSGTLDELEQLKEDLEQLKERARTQGASADELRKMDEALEDFTKAIKLDSSEDERQKLDEARKRLADALKSDPDGRREVEERLKQIREGRERQFEPKPPPNVALVHTLVWPMVAAVAIIALFLIAWKAITRGQNIEISWKVTEKITGRVVITKVKTRAAIAKRRAAAA
jgi:hypothetical protein